VKRKFNNKEVIYKGKKLRSKLEKTAYQLLNEAGIEFEYEPTSFILIPKFKYTSGTCYERVSYRGKKTFKEKPTKTISKISYTPDFVGKNWIMETKGYETPSFKLRWKLFKKHLQETGQEYVLFKPHNKKEIQRCIEIIKSLDNGTNNPNQKMAQRKRKSKRSSKKK